MADFVTDLSQVIPAHLRDGVKQELLAGWRAQEAKALAKSKEMANFNHHNEARSIEGIGQMVARIPLVAFHYWGNRLGYECWEDKQFMKEFLRDNPEAAVRNYAKKTAVNGAIFTADGTLLK